MDGNDKCTSHCSQPYSGQRYCGTGTSYTGEGSIDCSGCAPDPNICPQDCFSSTCWAGSSSNGGKELLDMQRCTDTCSKVMGGRRYCGAGSSYTGEGSIDCSGCAQLTCSYKEAQDGKSCDKNTSPYQLTKVISSNECQSAASSLEYKWQEAISSDVPSGGCYVNAKAAKMSFKSGAALVEINQTQFGQSMQKDETDEGGCPGNKYTWMGEVLKKCQENFGAASVWDVKRGSGTYCQRGFDKCITPYYVECCTRPETATKTDETAGSWSEICRICSV